MLREVCVDQGEMLTEAPVYKAPVQKPGTGKAEADGSGRKGKKVTAVKTSGDIKNSYEDPFAGMNSQEIEEEMERMFRDAFTKINKNFGEVFRELFGGGHEGDKAWRRTKIGGLLNFTKKTGNEKQTPENIRKQKEEKEQAELCEKTRCCVWAEQYYGSCLFSSLSGA